MVFMVTQSTQKHERYLTDVEAVKHSLEQLFTCIVHKCMTKKGKELVWQAGEMKVKPLGSVPEKTVALDYYSEGMFIVDASQPAKCSIVWLNSICRDMIGEQPSHI